MSFFGQILNPIFQLFSEILAYYYSLVPNYAVAIGLLTITVMLLVSPLTVKSTRSMLEMQKLQPEIKQIQNKYKGDRIAINEEIAALMKEHRVNPASGCLPLVLQFPAFLVLYQVVKGLIATSGPHHVPSPKYISHSTLLYQNLVAGGGSMKSFGLDLARSATSFHGGFLGALPYYGIVALAIGLYYLQIAQMTNRNPSAMAANPSAAKMQKMMPIVMGFIYIAIPAAVNVYFVISSLFRIGQQTLMYRYDPKVKAAVAATKASAVINVKEAQPRAGSTARSGPSANGSARDGGNTRRAARAATSTNGSRPAPGAAKSLSAKRDGSKPALASPSDRSAADDGSSANGSAGNGRAGPQRSRSQRGVRNGSGEPKAPPPAANGTNRAGYQGNRSTNRARRGR